jgi:hypothetical protein
MIKLYYYYFFFYVMFPLFLFSMFVIILSFLSNAKLKVVNIYLTIARKMSP